MDCQKTIREEVRYTGVGLHTGNKATITFKPAPVNSGVQFVRTDLPGKPGIAANIFMAADIPRRTTLRNGEVEVHTVEHILAALAGLGLDNLTIEVNANEVPEIDGSALPFASLLAQGGIVPQEEAKRYARLTEPVYVSEEGSSVAAFPAKELGISFTLDYDHPYLRTQFASFSITLDIFEKEIAAARTFCLEEEAKVLQARGLGKGANFQNTLLVGDKGIIEGELRFEDEFVRHKILDLMGDLFLLGCPLQAQIIATRSGHSLNTKLIRRIKKTLSAVPTSARIKDSQRSPSTLPSLPAPGRRALETEEQLLDVEAIQKILPHRYPFLLVDKIIEMEDDKRIVGIKNVTINEPFFSGHFPGKAIMPGVLIIEALAQTAGVLMLKKAENRGKLAYLAAIDKVKLRRPVVPGDQLRLEIKVRKLRRRTGKIESQALVRGKVVAEAELIFSLVEA
ncbi:bifunctional UDP-3-O-[3-hydroxymyristoyl] N-acetylglucosamine deacetylase/3-hydroxyacyl-ACP dehydratase [candidate division NPL-UPA2 bacterium]|nr:bifunctional UDP-3-O-[3-hydroxymyristoyl] N-acetylglucosamine deacetylase/3-hydroxyacyl-ACP dehydratase [candidate division NPL-UPA2 bacterium]